MSRQEEREQVERVRKVFDAWAQAGRSESMEEKHGPAARPVFDRLGLSEKSWYLDVGCGNGYTVRWAAAIATSGRAYGVDVSLPMIEKAKAMSRGLTNVEYLCSAFPEDALPDARFDAIFSMEAFYYLPDLDAALARIRTLLRPGGRFACVVDYYAENTASHPWRKQLGVRMRLLSTLGWTQAFERAGLTVIDQGRSRLPPELASEEWKSKHGSLFTIGRR